MTAQAVSTRPQTKIALKVPYSPSWIDRFTDWVDRLPTPAWAFYLVFGCLVVLVETAIQWREGAYPGGTFKLNHIWGFGFIAYEIALIHYLDRLAANALKTFKPLLKDDPPTPGAGMSTEDDLLYRLTTLPTWPTLLVALLGGAIVPITYYAATSAGITPNYLVGTARTSLSDIAFMLSFIPANAVLGVLLYHTVHQLVIVSRIYTRHARINLYQLQPLYALSRLGALTSVGLSAVLYMFFLTTPEGASTTGGTRPFELAMGGFFALIAVMTFILPLWGAHRRIVGEKNRRLEQVAFRFEAATDQLHRQLDSGTLEDMGNLNRALASLELEQEALRKIPTWPWEPGVARSVIFALLFPLVTWTLQRILGQVLGS